METNDNGSAPKDGAGEGCTAPPWMRSDTFALLGVFLIALMIRGLYVYQQRSSPDFDRPMVDAVYFDQWGQAFAKGESFTDGPYYRAPLYPWCLGTVYALFGQGTLPPRMVQAVLGSLTCGLVFLIGRLAFNRTVGLVAGVGAASYWILVYFTGELLIPTLIVFLDMLLILLLLEAHRRRSGVLWGLSGLVLGLSAIARPTILLFAPAIVIWMAALPRRSWPELLRTAAVFTAGVALPILPITVRNYVVGHDRVLISSQGGVNLYIGNNPQAKGHGVTLPGTRWNWHLTSLDQIAIAEKAEGRKLKPSEVSGYYLRKTWEFVSGQPGAAAKLLCWKTVLLFNSYEFGNNKDIYGYTQRYTPIVRYLPLWFGLVGPLGFLGLVVLWPRRVELFPLWGFVLTYAATVVLFFVSARFRVPLVPALILYGAALCDWIVRRVAQRQWEVVLKASVALALLLVFAHLGEARIVSGSWEQKLRVISGGEENSGPHPDDGVRPLPQ